MAEVRRALEQGVTTKPAGRIPSIAGLPFANLMLSMALLAGLGSHPAEAQSTWPFWDQYAKHFLSPQARVIDPDRNDMTTSEGQSYALFFSLVANDRSSFQNILAWTDNNLARGDVSKNLPAWSWGRNSDGSWGVLDPNSASDSDLWIAYSLTEAGTLWGEPNYIRKGKELLSLIAQTEVANVPHAGPVMIPGKTGFHRGSDEWVLNPSYLPLPLLFAANHYAPQGPWKQMALNLPRWLAQAHPVGFAMDWVKCDAKGCSPAVWPENSSGPARGSYDAIRVYLWAGMTAKETPGAAKVLEMFSPMLRFVKAHSVSPESVTADGTILSASGPASFSAALIPFAVSSGEQGVAGRLQQNVEAEISKTTGLLGNPPAYYEQNLALFGLGWQEHRFWFAPDGTLRVQWKK